MTLEVATSIAGLNPAYPESTSGKNQGDDHIRLLKTVLQAAFPDMGGALFRHSTKTTTTTVADDANGIIYRTTGSWTLTGPDNGGSIPDNGFTFQVDNSAGAGTITFTPQHSQTVNGGASLSITAGRRYRVRSNGTAWVAEEYGVFASVAAQLPKGIFAASLSEAPPYHSVQKLPATAEIVDVDSAYNLGLSRFVAPRTAVYLFFVSAAAVSSDNNREFDFALYLYKNGAQASNNYAGRVQAISGDVSRRSFTIMIPLSLAANDYVEVYLQGTTPGTTGGSYYLTVTGTIVGFPVT